ncbi:MFS transporter [Nonomuraea sp. NEAU-A123]|uniref:MFS transporter n=1 Tax=Nonomuraea sp. NEAU-A123 TaxID=2839649 RepID=UPI001BE4C51A|nr:MFS transporter [Nonomuraea sp. NEAU-A123]MBT2231311.1 MFS transporter [Nonomuraea sp. NEAU-A123]
MTPRSALRRYQLVSFLTWLPPGLSMAVMVLLMTDRGLSLAQVGLVVMVFSSVTIGLELPTGGLADVIGRRTVLAISAAFTVVALALMAVSTTFWMFLATCVLKGVARALSSGPATAWYVDTLHDLEGPGADLKPGLARGGAMESVALCLGVLVGGFAPLAVPPGVMTPLAVPPLLGATAGLVLLAAVLFALPEPSHAHRSPGVSRGRWSLARVLRDVPATVAGGVRLVAGAAVLRRLMLAAAASGVALVAVELLTPGRLAALAGTAELGSTGYAIVAALGFAGSAVGSALAPRVAGLAGGSVRGAVAGTVLTALAIAALAATAGLDGPPGFAATGLAYVVMFSGLSMAGLLCLEMTHNAVTAAQRTTVTSTSSLSLQAGAGVSNVVFGTLAVQAGLSSTWSLAAAVVLGSALLFVRMPPLAEPHRLTSGGAPAKNAHVTAPSPVSRRSVSLEGDQPRTEDGAGPCGP